MDVLSRASSQYGVFYPLQSFTFGEKISFRNIPILIEAFDPKIEKILLQLGESLSQKVENANSAQRKYIHLAAVFASNFSNHLLHMASEILKSSGKDLSLLEPLLDGSLSKAVKLGPKNAQTGPASREDYETIQAQLSMLEGNPDWVEVYELFTRQIIDLKSGKR